MTPKLYKAAEVCDMAQLQPYVLRSWEKEFPGIGVQREQDGPRLYRQSDVDQVLRIKQLVFVEGLTLSGARRRLEDSHEAPVVAAPVAVEAPVRTERPRAVAAAPTTGDTRARIASVREGLESILTLLSGRPGARVDTLPAEEYRLEAPVERKVRKLPARRPAEPAAPASKRTRARA